MPWLLVRLRGFCFGTVLLGTIAVGLSVARPPLSGGEPDQAGPDWWSLRPLARPAVPKVSDPAWCRNPIDAFVLAKLDSQHLRASPPADRPIWLRRVTFDLIGLPPSPEEIDA